MLLACHNLEIYFGSKESSFASVGPSGKLEKFNLDGRLTVVQFCMRETG